MEPFRKEPLQEPCSEHNGPHMVPPALPKGPKDPVIRGFKRLRMGSIRVLQWLHKRDCLQDSGAWELGFSYVWGYHY